MKFKVVLITLLFYSTVCIFAQSLGVDRVHPSETVGQSKSDRRTELATYQVDQLKDKASMLLATLQLPITAGSIIMTDSGSSNYAVTFGGGVSGVLMLADATLDSNKKTYTIKPSLYAGLTIVGGYTPITSDNNNPSANVIFGGILGVYDLSLIYGYDIVNHKATWLFGTKIDSFKLTDSLTKVIGKIKER
jgi:hypothetical protein